MKRCKHCNAIILAGGVNEGLHTYCSDKCAISGQVIPKINEMSFDEINEKSLELYFQICPICSERKAVDLHKAHTSHSYIITISQLRQ